MIKRATPDLPSPAPITNHWDYTEALVRERVELRAEIERLRNDKAELLKKRNADEMQKMIDYWGHRAEKAEARIDRLEAALEPFARNVEAISLSATLGHITREDLWRARDTLAGKKGT